MAIAKKHPSSKVSHSSKKKKPLAERLLGYDGKDDGQRPLRMSIILATLLSILVLSVITYFVGGNA